MDMQTMFAEYEYRRRLTASQPKGASLWRRIMG
jgi:hypothetical protein